ncbi:MAG: agmatine deiminase family protein, partial [Candidatus Bathyarchaeota archaeon]
MIPEFAPQKAVWLQWPTSKYLAEEELDERNFIPAFVEIERECCTEGEVHNIVLNKDAERTAKQKLTYAGVPLDRIFFHIMPIDSCWMRDSGPIFLR